YFVWFWTHGGQTLPMKTWKIRLESARGAGLGAGHALLRLLCAGAFFGPACVALVLVMFPHRVSPVAAAWLVVPALATILWAQFDKDRQFLHDRLARTRLVRTDAPSAPGANAA
ncbi:MAG: RDD family protein, partial [Betaproteobacteria bacterium]|nr:RDD family protein [Betaproteobacteria bacterium]